MAGERSGRAAHASRSHGPHAPRRRGGSERLVMLPMLAAAVLLQGAEVTASVDRTRLRVGEQLVLTVRARTRTVDPVEIVLPTLNGFAVGGPARPRRRRPPRPARRTGPSPSRPR